MTAAVRQVPDSTNGTPPYDGETWQRDVNNEVKALWQVATTRLTSVAGTNDLTASSDTALVAAIAAYAQPMSFWITPPHANTGGMTINIDGVGVVYLKDKAAATLPGGAIDGVSQYLICFDGTGFRVHGTGSGSGSASANVAPGMILRDEKATGTAGGTFTNGSFAQRTLNSAVRNVLSGASLSANQFTLQAGTYLIEWSAPATGVGAHQTRLFNATDSVTVETGTSEVSQSGSNYTTRSIGLAVVTITSAKAFEIDHICQSTLATNGLGFPAGSAAKEVYTWVNVWQVGALASQANGVPGGAVTWPVLFSTTTTDADPGPGTLRLNNATQNAATITYIDLLDANGTDLTSVIDSFNLNGGQVRLVKYDDPTKWIIFNVTSWTTATGYRKLGLSIVGQSAASPFANGDKLYFAFTQAGSPADVTANHVWTGTNQFNSSTGFGVVGTGTSQYHVTINGQSGSGATTYIAWAKNGVEKWQQGITPAGTSDNYYMYADGSALFAYQIDTATSSMAFGSTVAATSPTTGAATFAGGIGVNGSMFAIQIFGVNFILCEGNGGIGYTTGAGGTVTQATSKSNAVTLNKATGTITLNGSTMTSGQVVTFGFNNSAIAATDQIVVTHESVGSFGSYLLNARATGPGTASIDIRNLNSGSLSEAIVLRFYINKSVNS